MPFYIEFASDDTIPLLLEADEPEVPAGDGIDKAGLWPSRAQVREHVAQARATFNDAVRVAVVENARVMTEAMASLQDPPDEMELTFGLKATGELGNIAIGKTGGEANLQVKLKWNAGSLPRRPPDGTTGERST